MVINKYYKINNIQYFIHVLVLKDLRENNVYKCEMKYFPLSKQEICW